MCGICGVLGLPGRPLPDERSLRAMRESLRHRGPDDGGDWVDVPRSVYLGHRRLSVLDLSPLGRQPMVSACGRYVVTFNGEIYNFRTLRRELERRGRGFRGTSDTEVLLAAVAEWGVEEALGRFNGMFAFGLWDRREERLWLARDRLGEKPLYYGKVGGTFLFASELKALRRCPEFPGTVSRDALTLFLKYGYVPAPWSIYAGVFKLRPGHLLVADRTNGEVRFQERPYWSVRDHLRTEPAAEASDLELGEAEERLEELLLDAVRLRLESDVPLGAFLSGGMDSSTVVALMGRVAGGRVRTFTIGFHEQGYDEAQAARRVARHLGTDHTELYVTPAEARAVIPRLPEIYDEPFADSSQIPTFLVSQLARRHVTVALSGDGGDELFGGYARYAVAEILWRKVRRIPAFLRNGMATLVGALWPEDLDAWAGRALEILAPRLERRGRRLRLRRLAGLLRFRGFADLYEDLVSQWKNASEVVGGARRVQVEAFVNGDPSLSPLASMTTTDLTTYLPDDILVKVDRASMAVSLEVRTPFLDPRLVEWAVRLPVSFKVRDGVAKWLLRRVLHRHVPPALVERPKMGFGVPMGAWLRGPLREWAEDLMDPQRLRREGFLSAPQVRKEWSDHISGKADRHSPLWAVLMFQAWLEKERDLAPRARPDAAA